MKKKRIVCVACLLCLASVIGYQTVAYFTEESTTTNVISTGYVEMELFERIQADGVTWEYIPIDEVTSVWPGDVVKQEAYVTNTGSEDFYARVSVEIEIESVEGEALDPSVVTLTFNDEYWKLDSDGWYRYVDIVQVGDTTEYPLFTEVNFSTEMDNDYIGCIITIIVDSQSVQSRYNGYDTSIGETVLDVDGFPEISQEGEVRQ